MAKNETATINPKNNDDKCCQYALTNALHYEQITDHPERISKIKSFIDQYNIYFNILYVCHNTEKIRHAYKSKYNLKRKNQVILLMITDGEKWHYLAVKGLSALFTGIAGNNKGDFYCLNCFK